MTEYAKQMEESDETFVWHFREEFDLDYNNGYKFLLSEKHGTYDGLMSFVVEISKQLAQDIEEGKGNSIRYELNKDDLIDEEGKEFFQNIFFDKIIIDHSTTNKNSAYLPNKSHYDENKKLLDVVYIELNGNEEDNYEKLVRTLAHELTHAYENYKRLMTGKDPLSTLVSKNTRYYKAINYYNDGSFEDCVKAMEYVLSSFEKNAFLTELEAILSDKKVHSYQDALNLFKKTEIWQKYNGLYNIIHDEETNWEDFTDTYNEEFETNYSVTRFKKWLTNRVDKTYNKMMKLVPKIYFDHYEKDKKEEIKEGNILPSLYKGLNRLENYKIKLNNFDRFKK